MNALGRRTLRDRRRSRQRSSIVAADLTVSVELANVTKRPTSRPIEAKIIYRGRRFNGLGRTGERHKTSDVEADRDKDHLSWPQINGLGRTGERHKTSDVEADRGASS